MHVYLHMTHTHIFTHEHTPATNFESSHDHKCNSCGNRPPSRTVKDLLLPLISPNVVTIMPCQPLQIRIPSLCSQQPHRPILDDTFHKCHGDTAGNMKSIVAWVSDQDLFRDVIWQNIVISVADINLCSLELCSWCMCQLSGISDYGMRVAKCSVTVQLKGTNITRPTSVWMCPPPPPTSQLLNAFCFAHTFLSF